MDFVLYLSDAHLSSGEVFADMEVFHIEDGLIRLEIRYSNSDDSMYILLDEDAVADLFNILRRRITDEL